MPWYFQVKISKNLGQKNIATASIIDLSKIFHSLCHQKTGGKVAGVEFLKELNEFPNHSSMNNQKVKLENIFSDYLRVDRGAPKAPTLDIYLFYYLLIFLRNTGQIKISFSVWKWNHSLESLFQCYRKKRDILKIFTSHWTIPIEWNKIERIQKKVPDYCSIQNFYKKKLESLKLVLN